MGKSYQKGEVMKSFLLEGFKVNGKNISGLSGSVPPEVEQKEAVEQIETWCGNVILRRTAEEAQKFFQEGCNKVFSNGVEVKTHAAEVVTGGDKG